MTVIEFKSLDDLLAELALEATCIADKIVRWQVNRIPIGNAGVRFGVDCWATALRIAPPDNGLPGETYLLECGLPCGNDDLEIPEADGGGPVGSNTAEQYHRLLVDTCDDLGLNVRAGKIEVY